MPFKRSFRRRSNFRGSSRRRGTYWDWNGYAGTATAGNFYSDWMVLPAIPERALRASTNLGYEQPREDVTLERTLIDATVQTLQSTTDEDTLYIGLMAWDQDDPTTTPAAPPFASNRADEWIWNLAVCFPKNTFINPIVTIASLTDPNKTQVRSKRKLPASTGIIIVVDASFCSTDKNFNLDFRFLFKKAR